MPGSKSTPSRMRDLGVRYDATANPFVTRDMTYYGAFAHDRPVPFSSFKKFRRLRYPDNIRRWAAR